MQSAGKLVKEEEEEEEEPTCVISKENHDWKLSLVLPLLHLVLVFLWLICGYI